jgi:hypothetical protein
LRNYETPSSNFGSKRYGHEDTEKGWQRYGGGKMPNDRNIVGSKMPNEIETERIDLTQVVK